MNYEFDLLSEEEKKLIIDGVPKNVNPLKEAPIPKMAIYAFSIGKKSKYFDIEDDLIEYVVKNNIDYDKIYMVEYLGDVAGRSDVIKINSKNSEIICSPIDEDGYAIYNAKRSIYKGRFIWEYKDGSLKEIYDAFRDRGIVFKNDIYKRWECRNRQLMKMFKNDRNS